MKNAMRCGLVLISTLLAACGSSPRVSFYTLESPIASAASSTAAAEYSVVIGPVTVPEMLDRPQLVVRTAPHQVEILELARWAEPLRDAIPRAVASEVQARLPNARVAAATPELAAAADYRVAIAFEKIDAASGDAVTIDALWTITTPDGARTGRTSAREAAGRGDAEVVAAHARALRRVSEDIAAAIADARSQTAQRYKR